MRSPSRNLTGTASTRQGLASSTASNRQRKPVARYVLFSSVILYERSLFGELSVAGVDSAWTVWSENFS
jgi:hypothetical protein